MTIEEAIVYTLATSGHGMRTEQIAREINEQGLFTRWDKAPVDGKMIYAVVMSHPDTFVKSEGRIRLII
ncbi:MAG: winged helix-turn-helix domain-containing protein [Bacteroidales bacterium]|nr:winged helix-turn-helix domain-containing protein [Bacteroidales bacterium]